MKLIQLCLQVTTAVCTMWLLYCLAKNPEYQIKVQEEVDALLKGRDLENIQWSDLTELSLLTLCVKESMRLYPPVPFIERELAEDTIIDGHIIPQGTHIGVAIIFLHRHPLIWEDPDEFRYTIELAPDRPAPIRYPQVTLQSENGMWLKFKPRT